MNPFFAHFLVTETPVSQHVTNYGDDGEEDEQMLPIVTHTRTMQKSAIDYLRKTEHCNQQCANDIAPAVEELTAEREDGKYGQDKQTEIEHYLQHSQRCGFAYCTRDECPVAKSDKVFQNLWIIRIACQIVHTDSKSRRE